MDSMQAAGSSACARPRAFKTVRRREAVDLFVTRKSITKQAAPSSKSILLLHVCSVAGRCRRNQARRRAAERVPIRNLRTVQRPLMRAANRPMRAQWMCRRAGFEMLMTRW